MDGTKHETVTFSHERQNVECSIPMTLVLAHGVDSDKLCTVIREVSGESANARASIVVDILLITATQTY